MTDQIFLSEILLDNFRSFGAERRIPLHPGPSVLMLAGANGLGKTTLIEGIEWALTDGIRRFTGRHPSKDIEAALTRRARGVRAGSHGVTLTFDDGTVITRGPKSRPKKEQVIKDLAVPDWPHPIHDLSAYLGLTHFMSQSPILRLTSRSPEERWKDLKDLTGAARIDRMMERLGQGIKLQLFNGAKRAAEKRDALAKAREELEDLLRQIREHDALLGAAAAYPAEHVMEEGRALIDRLQAAAGTAMSRPDNAADLLKALALAVEQAQATTEAQRTALARAEAQLQPWQARVAQLMPLDRSIAGVNALLTACGQVHQAEETRDQLERRRSLLARLPALDATIQAASDQLEDCRAAGAAAQDAQAELKALDALVAEMDEHVRSDEKILEGWRALADAGSRAHNALRAVTDEAPDRAAAQAAYDAAKAHQEELLHAHTQAELELAEAEARRVAAAESVEGKAVHLSALVKELHEGHTECPLCLTEHGKGELLARARRALERQDPELKVATERVSAVRGDLGARVDALTKHAPRLAAALARLDAFNTREGEAKALAEGLRHDPRIGGRPLEGLTEWLADRLAAAEVDVAQRREERRALDPHDTLQDRLLRAADAVTRANEAIEAAENALRQRRAERDEVARDALAAVLGSLDQDLPATEAALAEAEQAVAKAKRDLAAAERALDPGLGVSDGKQPLAQWASEKLAALAAQREPLAVAQEAALHVWQAAGFAGEPAAATLALARAQAEAWVDVVRGVGERCAALTAGYERWCADERQQRLRKSIDDLVKKHDAPDAVACLSSLDERIAAAELDARAWSRARGLVDAVGSKIEDEQNDFIQAIIEPLEERANAFDLAWSSFPDRRVGMEHRRLRNKSKVEVLVDGDDAELRLSEGQAGVKALSFLLAASTSQPWSRWRALLLDDPLQYNDLVHKAAFLDVLRPLVRAERYQVIMSTHDIEEARFIERKCRNAGIAFSLCHLHAIGKNGVDYYLE
ncbi:AAA family ATPase [Azospirillum sp. sgz302134]